MTLRTPRIFVSVVQRIVLRASCMLGNCSTTGASLDFNLRLLVCFIHFDGIGN